MDGEIYSVDYNSPNLFTVETINSVVEYARTVSPRSHMIQLQHYPTTFAIVEMKIDGTYKLHVRRENVLVEEPSTPDDIINLGYSWYIEDERDDPQNRMSIQNYTLIHSNVSNKLNNAIKNHHGIVCTTQTNINNIQTNQYCFVLHIGDILICKLAEIEYQSKPQLYIKTQSFNKIPNNMIENLFHPILNDGCDLTEDEIVHLMLNADLYFHIYCYWKNNSNKPLRCVGYGISSLKRSQLILKSPYFQGNQITKLDALKRRTQGEFAKKLYMIN